MELKHDQISVSIADWKEENWKVFSVNVITDNTNGIGMVIAMVI